MRLLTGSRLFDDDAWMGAGNDARANAKRQRHAFSRRVARRQSEQDRTRETVKCGMHGVAGCWRAARFIAVRHLVEDNRGRPRKHTGEFQLRQHAIKPVRPLPYFIEEQDVSLRWIKRVRRAE